LRALFVSSAVMLADEFHIDGLRVDQTASIHSYNSLHADGSSVGRANIFGRKFLRELCQTVKTVRPGHMLIAEDHSGWPVVTQPAAGGGIGFDATWYVDFYHHLIGENGRGPEWAKLLLSAGQDPDKALAMDYFAGRSSPAQTGRWCTNPATTKPATTRGRRGRSSSLSTAPRSSATPGVTPKPVAVSRVP
jgi:1,4-alpha-glucan branching enzyme